MAIKDDYEIDLTKQKSTYEVKAGVSYIEIPYTNDPDKIRVTTREDVFTMSLIRQRQYEFAKTIPGLTESINLANRSIRPYITSIVQGVKYSQNEVDALVKENDELMSQYNRIIEKLIGPAGLAHCHAATKSNLS